MSKYVCDTCGDAQDFGEIMSSTCLSGSVNVKGMYSPPCGGRYIKADFATKADDIQIGGDHYKSLGLQPWDVMKAWATKKEFTAYLWLTTIKYLARWQRKNGVEDLKKARHYLDKLIEELEE